MVNFSYQFILTDFYRFINFLVLNRRNFIIIVVINFVFWAFNRLNFRIYLLSIWTTDFVIFFHYVIMINMISLLNWMIVYVFYIYI